MVSLQSDCRFNLECHLTKTFASLLCTAFQGGKICTIMNKVIGQKYDRQRKKDSIQKDVFAWYDINRNKDKYKKKRALFLQDLKNKIYNLQEQYDKLTKEEIQLEQAVKNNTGELATLLSTVVKNEDVKSMAKKILDMRRRNDNGVKSMIQELFYKVVSTAKTLFYGCLENIGTCLAIIATAVGAVSALVCYFLPPCGWVSTLIARNTFLYKSVVTFIQGLLGKQHAFAVKQINWVREPVDKNILLEQENELRNAPGWYQKGYNYVVSVFGSGGANIEQSAGNVVYEDGVYKNANHVGTELVKKESTVYQLKSFFDLVLMATVGIQPILGDWQAISTVIDYAYAASLTLTAGSAVYEGKSCLSGNSKDCVALGGRIMTYAVSKYFQSYLNPYNFSKSDILALHMEGKIITETFWLTMQQAAKYELFPSFIGKSRYKQLQLISRLRTAVALANLVFSSMSLVPVMVDDWGKGYKEILGAEVMLMDSKIMDVVWGYYGNRINFNLEEEKDLFEQSTEDIQNAMRDAKTKKDLVIQCKNMFGKQQQLLDQASFDIMKQRVKAFENVATKFQIAYCNTFSFSYKECLQYNDGYETRNLEDIENNDEKLALLLLYIDSYEQAYSYMLSILDEARKVDPSFTETIAVGEIKDNVKRISKLRNQAKVVEIGNFVETQIRKRDAMKKEIDNASFKVDKMKSMLDNLNDARKKANQEVENRIKIIHESMAGDKIDDLIRKVRKMDKDSSVPASMDDMPSYVPRDTLRQIALKF